MHFSACNILKFKIHKDIKKIYCNNKKFLFKCRLWTRINEFEHFFVILRFAALLRTKFLRLNFAYFSNNINVCKTGIFFILRCNICNLGRLLMTVMALRYLEFMFQQIHFFTRKLFSTIHYHQGLIATICFRFTVKMKRLIKSRDWN